MDDANLLEVSTGFSVSVTSLGDVLRSKEAMRGWTERSRRSCTMDSLHVLMGEETLALRKRYGYQVESLEPDRRVTI